MDWSFALLLFGALVLTGATSVWQTRRYTTEINRMAKAFAANNRQLVSGRARGRARGAVVALVVDPERDEVVEAKAMAGVSVFACLSPAPELVGSLSGVVGRATDSTIRTAVEDALTRVRALPTSSDVDNRLNSERE